MSDKFDKQAYELRLKLQHQENSLPTIAEQTAFERIISAALRQATEDAAKQEREACDKIVAACGKIVAACDQNEPGVYGNGVSSTVKWIRAAIRAHTATEPEPKR